MGGPKGPPIVVYFFYSVLGARILALSFNVLYTLSPVASDVEHSQPQVFSSHI